MLIKSSPKNNSIYNMLNKRFELIEMKPYLIIFTIYFLAHWFMLVLTGIFWDDWCYSLRDINQIKEVALQTGRPEWAFILPAVWGLPCYGYRKITFFLYLLGAMLFYNILKKSHLFSENESLLVTIIYIVIPVNDARVLLSNFIYALGLFLFLLTFYLFILWDKSEKRKYRFIMRIVLWALFSASFILNSILCLYYAIFIYLFFDRLSGAEGDINLRKIRNVLILIIRKFWDFAILPVICFVFKNVYFPVYGIYEDYNQVQVTRVMEALIKMPIVIIRTCFDAINNWLSVLSVGILIFLIVCLGLFLLAKLGKCNVQLKKNHVWLKFLVGFSILFLGLFPYEAIRMGNELGTFGISGRDSILLPLGFSILLANLIAYLDLGKQKMVVLVICALGILHFNSVYLTYQEDYYKQLALINEFSENDYVKENNTFYMINESDTSLGTQRFYSLAWNSYEAFGDQSRLYLCSLEEVEKFNDKIRLEKLINEEPRLYGLNDYDVEDTNLDGVLEFNALIGKRQLIKLKLLEICSKQRFEQEIAGIGNLAVFPLSK